MKHNSREETLLQYFAMFKKVKV